ncbi:MAG: hypothetical protein OEY09_11475 [Gammaproteobacteria bacterium]|nr:hypothetical protein [Gammaproteobacteria bacterium]
MNKLKLTISIFLTAWLFSSSLLAQSPSWGTNNFVNVGYIGNITYDSIMINDNRYHLSAATKFSTVENSDAGINHAKKGQMVGYKLMVINKRFIVDHLWLIPENEHSLYRR